MSSIESARSKAIYTCSSTANGLTSFVCRRNDGQYAVSLYDDDAEQFIDTIIITPNVVQAIAKAQSFATGVATKETL